MSGMPLSIDGQTSSTATSAGQQYGINQSPEIITEVGGSGDVAGILQALATSQIPATYGTINNATSSQTTTPIGNGVVNASVATPLGSVSTSINTTYILIGVGIVALLLWKFKGKGN